MRSVVAVGGRIVYLWSDDDAFAGRVWYNFVWKVKHNNDLVRTLTREVYLNRNRSCLMFLIEKSVSSEVWQTRRNALYEENLCLFNAVQENQPVYEHSWYHLRP